MQVAKNWLINFHTCKQNLRKTENFGNFFLSHTNIHLKWDFQCNKEVDRHLATYSESPIIRIIWPLSSFRITNIPIPKSDRKRNFPTLQYTLYTMGKEWRNFILLLFPCGIFSPKLEINTHKGEYLRSIGTQTNLYRKFAQIQYFFLI